jgi:type VI secretion system secreted protein VgrG
VVHGDSLEQVGRTQTVVVGAHDKPGAYVLHTLGVTELASTKQTLIRADTELVLQCGESMIRMTPGQVEIRSPRTVLHGAGGSIRLGDDTIKLVAKSAVTAMADVVSLHGSGGNLKLDADARLDGGTVKLASPTSESGEEDEAPPEPTKLELVDPEGHPLAGARYVLVMADGAERSGVLDADGKAEVVLEGVAEITFPGLGDPKKL